MLYSIITFSTMGEGTHFNILCFKFNIHIRNKKPLTLQRNFHKLYLSKFVLSAFVPITVYFLLNQQCYPPAMVFQVTCYCTCHQKTLKTFFFFLNYTNVSIEKDFSFMFPCKFFSCKSCRKICSHKVSAVAPFMCTCVVSINVLSHFF